MAFRHNDGSRNGTADGWAALYAGGTAQIRTGAQPASAADAASGTLLATITLPTPAFATGSGGAVTKNGTWSNTASASGPAGYMRIISADTLKNTDLNITETGGGGEAIINDENVVENGNVVVTAITITMPAS